MKPKCDNIDMGFTDERFPAGTHMCLIYNDESERKSVIKKFLEAGINAGEKVLYLVDDCTPEEFKTKLFESVTTTPRAKADDQLCVKTTEDGYCSGGKFDTQVMINNLRDFYKTSKDDGYKNVRGSGEMMWATRDIPGSEHLVEYEATLNDFLEDYPLTCICQYNANHFDGATIFNILKVHPMMIVHGQIVRNPYYLPPKEFLANHKPAHG